MSLEEKVNEGIKAAMKAREEARLRGLRAIKTALLLEKTSGSHKALSGADETRLLQKLAKQRRESLTIYREQQREDLARIEEEELAVLEEFLPRQMDEAALRESLKQIIAETGAATPADMGKVMGVATRKLAGKADGSAIAATVKALLSGQ
ncbi:GatB/YqeY domain-containing protein [Compostibacter hankyongensis]|uniref:GatB/YqeY domain-containing protein n=1 Tax=Compostibacter hankyongensis TaxID=1007089 RepID=A0ABP8FTC5_9BACT